MLSFEPRLRYRDASGLHEVTLEVAPQGEGSGAGAGSWRLLADDWSGELRVSREEAFFQLELQLTRRDNADAARLVDFEWRVGGVPESYDRVWHMTFNCWGQPGIVPRASLMEEPEQPPAWRAAFVDPAGGEGIVFSYRLPARWIHLLRTTSNGEAIFTSRIDADLAPGATWTNELWAISRGNPETLLAGPGTFNVSRRRPEEIRDHGGWNSWDYYRQDVDPDAIRENLEAIRGNETLRRFVRYIIIDDGWQTLDGDWEANEKFPGGMEAIAREIREAGFIPGIWTAPLMVNSRTDLFAQHPDWFVQYEGAPLSAFANQGCTGVWGERYFLDPTHPETVRHIDRLYRKLRGWGFGYFKTDFLTNCFTAHLGEHLPDRGEKLQYHDHSNGVLAAHRRCMAALRDAIGPESFWLGCGSIWATGAGLMDASRTSGDIAPHSIALTKCAATAFFNGHEHGRVFLNDPDFLVIRGKETSKPGLLDIADENLVTATPGKHRSGPFFSASEARIWASLVLLSGGMVTLSDRLAALNGTGIEIVEKTCEKALRSSGRPAFPLDRSQELPTAALRSTPGDELLGLFNWADSTAEPLAGIRVELPERRWKDLWSGREVATSDLRRLALDPRSVLLLEPKG